MYILSYCTVVKRAPLIHFQKLFLNKVFYALKLVQKLKFYTWIIISGSNRVKKGQKMLKKAKHVFQKKIALPNFKYINS